MGHPDTIGVKHDEALVGKGVQDRIDLGAIIPTVEVNPSDLAAGKLAAPTYDGHASQHLLCQDLLVCWQRVIDIVGTGLHCPTYAACLAISMVCQPVAFAILPCK